MTYLMYFSASRRSIALLMKSVNFDGTCDIFCFAHRDSTASGPSRHIINLKTIDCQDEGITLAGV